MIDAPTPFAVTHQAYPYLQHRSPGSLQNYGSLSRGQSLWSFDQCKNVWQLWFERSI